MRIQIYLPKITRICADLDPQPVLWIRIGINSKQTKKVDKLNYFQKISIYCPKYWKLWHWWEKNVVNWQCWDRVKMTFWFFNMLKIGVESAWGSALFLGQSGSRSGSGSATKRCRSTPLSAILILSISCRKNMLFILHIRLVKLSCQSKGRGCLCVWHCPLSTQFR